jgi:hypothetical protein
MRDAPEAGTFYECAAKGSSPIAFLSVSPPNTAQVVKSHTITVEVLIDIGPFTEIVSYLSHQCLLP